MIMGSSEPFLSRLNMRPKVYSIDFTAAPDADGICAAQAVGGAGALSLNGALISGGQYDSTIPFSIEITSTGNESARTFTIVGLDQDGNSQTTTKAGPNATTTVVTDYFWTRITSISIDGAAAGNVSVGQTDEACTHTIPLSLRGPNGQAAALQLVLSGTINVDVEYCVANVLALNAQNVTWNNHASLAAKTSSADGTITTPVSAIRLRVNSYTYAAGIIAKLHVLPVYG